MPAELGRHAETGRHRARDGARPGDPVPRRASSGLDPSRGLARRDVGGCPAIWASRSSSSHDLGSVFVATDRVILLDRRAKGIIAEGDPAFRDRRRTAGPRVLRREARPRGIPMSLRANYFKLGLFVIGAVVGCDRAGRDRFRPLVPAQAHDRNVLQRVGAGARRRIEAQVSGCGDRRSDADRLHVQQVPAGKADAAALPVCAGRGPDPAQAARRPRGRRRSHRAAIRQYGDRGSRMRLTRRGSPGPAISRSTTSSPPPRP